MGLENITEYQSRDPADVPYYHCDLKYCKDVQGNAETMKNHVFTARHKRLWLFLKTGEYLEHQNEISQKIAKYTRDFQRNYNLIREVVDRSQWRKAKDQRIQTVERRGVKRERSPNDKCRERESQHSKHNSST